MHFLSNILEDYIEEHSQSEHELLTELTRETHLKGVQPRMIMGHFISGAKKYYIASQKWVYGNSQKVNHFYKSTRWLDKA